VITMGFDATRFLSRSTVLLWSAISLLTLSTFALLLANTSSPKRGMLGGIIIGVLFAATNLVAEYLVPLYSR
jgi:hypothetical protein